MNIDSASLQLIIIGIILVRSMGSRNPMIGRKVESEYDYPGNSNERIEITRNTSYYFLFMRIFEISKIINNK